MKKHWPFYLPVVLLPVCFYAFGSRLMNLAPPRDTPIAFHATQLDHFQAGLLMSILCGLLLWAERSLLRGPRKRKGIRPLQLIPIALIAENFLLFGMLIKLQLVPSDIVLYNSGFLFLIVLLTVHLLNFFCGEVSQESRAAALLSVLPWAASFAAQLGFLVSYRLTHGDNFTFSTGYIYWHDYPVFYLTAFLSGFFVGLDPSVFSGRGKWSFSLRSLILFVPLLAIAVVTLPPLLSWFPGNSRFLSFTDVGLMNYLTVLLLGNTLSCGIRKTGPA